MTPESVRRMRQLRALLKRGEPRRRLIELGYTPRQINCQTRLLLGVGIVVGAERYADELREGLASPNSPTVAVDVYMRRKFPAFLEVDE